MEIEVGEEVAEALTEEVTAEIGEVRAALVEETGGQETGPVPSQSAVTPTLPGGTSATSARILRRSAWEVKEAAAEVTEVTEEEVEGMVEGATEMTDEEAEGALEETEGEEEEEVTEAVMTEEGAAEDSEAAEIEMTGEEEEAALEAEGAVVTVVAVALGVETDAAEAEDLEIGVAGAPWEEGGGEVTGTGLTRH